ncbi:hypothetical protein OIU79_027987 [Salix purpurea]|uniref:BCD1 alpha/beta domain-containing protein n=1 Tax=Salix purpurea TaxID=77065 RepID=A0A9Q1A2G4_SALPP|nr:hypothetical protein OIU79_027987 [Salix purpurea]
MIISSCPIIICLRKSRGRLSLHGGRELNYTHALLILDFHLTVKTLNVLLQDGEQSSFFFQVECQGRKRIKLYTTQGRNLSLGQLSGGFTQLMLSLHDHGVHEDTELFSAIEKHLKPGPWNHPLKQFCDEHLDSLKFFIRKYPKGPKSAFREIDIKGLFKAAISQYVRLVNHRLDAKNSVSNDCPSPKGIVFREEKIEDDANICSSDPQVYDLMKNEILSPSNEICDRNASLKALENIFDDSLAVREAAANGVHSSSKSEETFENMEFDFDQVEEELEEGEIAE